MRLPGTIRKGLYALAVLMPLATVLATAGRAEPDAEAPQSMTVERLGELILLVDDEAELQGASWLFKIEGHDAIVVYDLNADRMRIINPIESAEELNPARLMRLMQANFDAALDARYAIAQGMLWGTFIHPLSSLSDEEFLTGLAQTVNVVSSYGSSYDSGMFIFGSGDSVEIERRRLIDKLRELQT